MPISTCRWPLHFVLPARQPRPAALDIYGCTKQVENFASESLTQPSGLVLSEHHVVVGNYDTGIVVAFEKVCALLYHL